MHCALWAMSLTNKVTGRSAENVDGVGIISSADTSSKLPNAQDLSYGDRLRSIWIFHAMCTKGQKLSGLDMLYIRAITSHGKGAWCFVGCVEPTRKANEFATLLKSVARGQQVHSWHKAFVRSEKGSTLLASVVSGPSTPEPQNQMNIYSLCSYEHHGSCMPDRLVA